MHYQMAGNIKHHMKGTGTDWSKSLLYRMRDCDAHRISYNTLKSWNSKDAFKTLSTFVSTWPTRPKKKKQELSGLRDQRFPAKAETPSPESGSLSTRVANQHLLDCTGACFSSFSFSNGLSVFRMLPGAFLDLSLWWKGAGNINSWKEAIEWSQCGVLYWIDIISPQEAHAQ